MAPLNSALVTKDITINAPPSAVREVLLDFARIPGWKNNFITSLSVRRASSGEQIQGIEAEPGDILTHTSPQAGVNEAIIEFNTPTKYGWKGGAFGMVTHHWFEFLPSPGDEGKTLLKQFETLEGGAAFMFMAYSPARLWVESLYVGFNEDVKKAVEVL